MKCGMPSVLRTEAVILSGSEGIEASKQNGAGADMCFSFLGSHPAVCRQT